MSFTKESPRRKMEHLEKKQRLVFSGQFLSLCLLFEHDSYHCYEFAALTEEEVERIGTLNRDSLQGLVLQAEIEL